VDAWSLRAAIFEVREAISESFAASWTTNLSLSEADEERAATWLSFAASDCFASVSSLTTFL
jgi:hypothetical protein